MLFDPFELEMDITPSSTRDALKGKDYSKALSMALKLNQVDLTREVIEQTPAEKDQVLLLANNLPQRYLKLLFDHIPINYKLLLLVIAH